MRGWAGCVALLMLAGCAGTDPDETLANETEAAPEAVVVAEPAGIAAERSDVVNCVPGDDDGIGGTGCQTD